MFYALLLLVGALLALVYAQDEGLDKRCQFTVDDQHFDLCPILGGDNAGKVITITQDRLTPPTTTKTEYKISLNGPLKRDGTLPSQYQCPEGTWICMTMYNRRLHHESEPPLVLQTVPIAGSMSLEENNDIVVSGTYKPGLNIRAALTDSRQNPKHKVLKVRLHGGYYVDRPQAADLLFYCDHNTESSGPSPFYNWNGTHAFIWKTKHACSLKTPPPENDSPPSNEDGGEETQPPPNQADDEKELIEIPNNAGFRRTAWPIFLPSAALVLVAVYLIYWPPRRLRQAVSSYLKSHPRLLRFRVGENVLVRWAQEDLELEDGEEDVMVNGEREPLFVLEEEDGIPLKPSPRKGRTSLYGSVL
ncbi:hypothetical protein K474DRAFT_1599538 [Panus rudis PR-1116 ss-1]|nr:hypothetical protein K474DRAFT_1599538 [Panus rudis PR-1116 ss-1]